MLATKYPELEKPVQYIRKLTLGEQWREIMFQRHIDRVDENTRKRYARLEKEQARIDGLAEGRAEGKAEGHAEGTNQEKLEIARKMKAMGISADQIQAITGLSPKTIKKL